MVVVNPLGTPAMYSEKVRTHPGTRILLWLAWYSLFFIVYIPLLIYN